jgi:hypothetical protein
LAWSRRQKRQWISPAVLSGRLASLDPVAVRYFGLDWTARPLQKAELPMVLRRRLLVALLGLSAAVWASPGLAQTGGTGGSGDDVTKADFAPIRLQRKDGDNWVDLSTTEAGTYLNQARCQCATPVQIVVQMVPASVSKLASVTTPGTEARLYVGTGCAGLNANNQPVCPASQILGSPLTSVGTLAQGPWTVATTVDKLFAAVGGCGTTLNTTLWLWLDSLGQGRPNAGVTGDGAPSLGVSLTGAPPAAPNGISVEGGDEALVVSWTLLSTTTYPNLAGYLVFCMRGDGLQVFDPSYYNSKYPNSQYLSSQTECQTVTPVTLTTFASAAGTTTATEVGAPTIFQTLDTRFLCSGLLPTTQSSTRISILQNGIPYTVGVAAVDTSGNASPIASGFVQKPVPTINLYQAYRDAGGQSPGGYCALAGRDARLGAIAFLASAGFLGLLIFRRRRRARRALSRGLPWLLVTLAAGSAQAQQVVSHAQTEERSAAQSGDYRSPREWAIELRFGPYAPDVDSEFSGGATPYKTMFGGKRHLMSQLEFDWQFFQAFGSLGVGAVVGYYNESAKAFVFDPTTGKCQPDPKSTTGACLLSGDMTSLRLIPVAALLVYRWDVAAAHWKIPLVPYAKLGLNYTFWEINNGNGNVPEYKGGHGSGGTAGWQAAAGMSLLLDILDPDAARGLDMETGVNHSYVFFEWNHVDASGLGMSKKLHVGDSRWVLGLMFEF